MLFSLEEDWERDMIIGWQGGEENIHVQVQLAKHKKYSKYTDQI